jgi:hypothetical protein
MRRLIIAIAFIAAIGSQVPASGFQTDEDVAVRPQVANIQAVKERVRERVRDRLHDWFDAKLTALTAPEPVVAEPVSPTYDTASSGGGVVISEAEAASYLRAAGFPEGVIPTMVDIGHRESGLCATAVYGYGCDGADHFYNGGPACSWLQLYECPGPSAMDPAVAAQYAYAKYKAAGYSLSPWAATA